jgi:hypothetical protein
LEKLTRQVTASLKERAFCVVFEADLDRCWPTEILAKDEREEKIAAFAKSQGWTVGFVTVDSRNSAIFRKAPY